MSANQNSDNQKQGQATDDAGKPIDSLLPEDTSAVSDLLHVLGIKKKSAPRPAEMSATASEHAASGSAPASQEGAAGKEELEADAQEPDAGEIAPARRADDTLEESEYGILPFAGDDMSLLPPVSPPEKKRKIRTSLVLAALLVVGAGIIKFVPYLLEPTPPSPDVVGSYNDKNITVEQLNQFITLEQAKEREHMLCPTHGYDHSKCDPSEECEAHPVDSLGGYREMVTRLASEQMIQQWADAKGITQRADVQHGMKDLLSDATVEQYISQLHDENITPDSISGWEVQQYYDANEKTYNGKPLSEVEDEIRKTLASKKDEDFFPQYIEELKKTAGLQVNFDILGVTEPTADEISAYYEKNIASFQTQATASYSEIRISGGDAANLATDAIRKIRSGESFESVAASFSKDGKAGTQTVIKGSGEAALETAVWKMKKGDISDPINNTDGSVSIIKLADLTTAGAKTLETVSAEIRGTLLAQNMEQEYTVRKSEMLFSVHSRRYTLGEFYTEFKELSPEYQSKSSTFENKKQLVEQIIAQELLLEKSGDGSSDAREEHSYEEMKIQYLSQILHQDEVDGKLAEPTEEEMRQFYEENKKSLVTPATVQLNWIWISQGKNGEKKEQAQKKADEALLAINGGMSFADAAKQYSEDPSSANGGQLEGELHKEYLAPPLADTAFTLEVGTVSGVLEYMDGYYILQVRARTEEQAQSYEQASEAIKSHLNEQRHTQLELDMESTMLKNANFTIYDKTIRRLLNNAKAEKGGAT